MSRLFFGRTEVLAAAGFPCPAVYATIKTGRIVSKQNWKLLSKADKKEWQMYVEEYDQKRIATAN